MPALGALATDVQEEARQAAALIWNAHREYMLAFRGITGAAREIFENRAWEQGAAHAERRARLYRDAVNGTWREMLSQCPQRLQEYQFWTCARQVFLERVREDYDADLALTFFYSIMRLALSGEDVPVEYADDGLAGRSAAADSGPVCDLYPAGPQSLRESIGRVLENCNFRTPFEDAKRDAALAAARLTREWRRQVAGSPPREIQVLRPLFFRDREAYIAAKLRSGSRELPVVFALKHEEPGIAIDAVLTGKEDMRNILFVSTRSTFHVSISRYREVIGFLDTLAPERGHPAMAAVVGFTHPARVALNQRLRQHLRDTGERFAPVPGRRGMAMVVFSPPSFPYVFKVVRDYSSKEGWAGRARVMDLYRWVHEMNRGRLMLDAWMYRNLRFPRAVFEEQVLAELIDGAPGSVRVDGATVVLKHVYAQRRVQPLNTFFEETAGRARRESVVDALGAFIKDLAAMGFFIGDHYGMPFNTGLTHGSSVVLFDFDDLGPLLRHRFRETPRLPDEGDEQLWNTEADGPWFSLSEFEVLVDEWESYLGVPPDLRDYFRRKHGDLFTTAYWEDVQRRVSSGELHYVLPYPPERRLVG